MAVTQDHSVTWQLVKDEITGISASAEVTTCKIEPNGGLKDICIRVKGTFSKKETVTVSQKHHSASSHSISFIYW